MEPSSYYVVQDIQSAMQLNKSGKETPSTVLDLTTSPSAAPAPKQKNKQLPDPQAIKGASE